MLLQTFLLAASFTVHPQVIPLPSTSFAAASRRTSAACVAAAQGDLSSLGLTPYLEKTVKALKMVPDQKLRYQQLVSVARALLCGTPIMYASAPRPLAHIRSRARAAPQLFLAKKLPPMDKALLVETNKVPGCLSTVHVHATLDAEGKVRFVGESDAQLTKGLVALLVMGLDGCTSDQIQRVQPEFIKFSGLEQSLTPGRNNGFLNMLSMMKRKAAALSTSSTPPPPPPPPPSPSPPPASAAGASRSGAPTMQAGGSGLGPVGTRIEESLRAAFNPSFLQLEDESSQHAGHAGARGLGGESHFALRIESPAFEGMRSLKRHQAVYAALSEEMKLIHALSIKAVTPDEAA